MSRMSPTCASGRRSPTTAPGPSRRAADGALDKRPAVSIALAKRKGANAVIVADEILQRLDTVRGPRRSRRSRRRRDAQLRRNRDREGGRAAVPSGARDRLDRAADHACDRLARGRRRAGHHPHDDPADALRLLADGLHDQPREPVRADLLDRHPGRRRHRGGREHRAPLEPCAASAA